MLPPFVLDVLKKDQAGLGYIKINEAK